MVFIADDLGAWLIGLMADAGHRRLTSFVLGSEQERALRRAGTAAVQLTAADAVPVGGERAETLTIVINELFSGSMPDMQDGQETLLEGMQAGIANVLAPLDDPALTATGQSSADMLGVSATVLAEKLASNLTREILLRGARGGPLTPLANQLSHDATRLQAKRMETMFTELASVVKETLRREATQPTGRRSPRRVFLSHTAELRNFPKERSFVDAAEAAVVKASDAVSDMAYFSARDDTPAELCKRMVRNADIYVGIIGLRYGTPVREEPAVSYTELEFSTATEAGVTRLMFLLDENEILPIPAGQLFDREPDRQARQRAFRERLLSGVTVGMVANPDQLELQLLQALYTSSGW